MKMAFSILPAQSFIISFFEYFLDNRLYITFSSDPGAPEPDEEKRSGKGAEGENSGNSVRGERLKIMTEDLFAENRSDEKGKGGDAVYDTRTLQV